MEENKSVDTEKQIGQSSDSNSLTGETNFNRSQQFDKSLESQKIEFLKQISIHQKSNFDSEKVTKNNIFTTHKEMHNRVPSPEFSYKRENKIFSSRPRGRPCGRTRSRRGRSRSRFMRNLGERPIEIKKAVLNSDFIVSNVENTELGVEVLQSNVLEKNGSAYELTDVNIPKPKLRRVNVSKQKPLIKLGTARNQIRRMSSESNSSDTSNSNSSDTSASSSSQTLKTTFQVSDFKKKNSKLNPSVLLTTTGRNDEKKNLSYNKKLKSCENFKSNKDPVNAKNVQEVNNGGLEKLCFSFQEAKKSSSEKIFQSREISKEINHDNVSEQSSLLCETNKKNVYPNRVVGLEDSSLCVEVANPLERKGVAKKSFQKMRRRLFSDDDENPELILGKPKILNVENTTDAKNNLLASHNVNSDNILLTKVDKPQQTVPTHLDLHNPKKDSIDFSNEISANPESSEIERCLSDGESSRSTIPVSPDMDDCENVDQLKDKRNLCSVAKKTLPPKLGSNKKSAESNKLFVFSQIERKLQLDTGNDSKGYSQCSDGDISKENATESESDEEIVNKSRKQNLYYKQGMDKIEIFEQHQTFISKLHIEPSSSNIAVETDSLNVDDVHQNTMRNTINTSINELHNKAEREQAFENAGHFTSQTGKMVSSDESDSEHCSIRNKKPRLLEEKLSKNNQFVLKTNDFSYQTSSYEQDLTSFKRKTTPLISNDYDQNDNSGFSFYGCKPKHVDLNSLSLKVCFDKQLLQIPVVNIAQTRNLFPKVVVEDIMIQLLKFYSFP